MSTILYDSGRVCSDPIERMITKANAGVETLRYFHEYKRHPSRVYNVGNIHTGSDDE